jgi:hypothetical protein
VIGVSGYNGVCVGGFSKNIEGEVVKNFLDLVSKINIVHNLHSFDIVNLFLSFLIPDLKSTLNKHLQKHVPSPLERSEPY